MRAMKDSSIEWIGQIPQEWKTIRLRSRFSFGKGLPITKSDLTEAGVGVISYGQIHSKSNIGTTVTPELVRYVDAKYLTTNESSLVTNGDFIFADTSEDISGCGNCVFIDVDDPLFAGYHTMILRPESDVSTKFYSYLFATDAWRSQIRAQASGVKLFSITQKMLRDTLLIEPSEEEKNRIVEYLDGKCAAIDALIAAKEKTNVLLKERRQSIIYEAVTKGLNTDVPMKDSGIEWIGQIPECWDVAALKRVATPSTGMTPSKANPQYWEGDIPWFSSKDIKSDYLFDSEDHISQQAVEECGLTVYDENSVVFCVRSGILRHTFPVSVLKCKGTINQDLRVLATSTVIDPEFLMYYLRGMNNTIVTLYQKVGATVESIEMEWLLYLPVALPSIGEQKRIAEYIVARCNEIDGQIAANEVSVTKLKEYRQSVIYEAVTGKIEI